MKKKLGIAFLSLIVVGVFAVGFSAPQVKAVTVAELQAQIQALLSQVQQLQTQITQLSGGQTAWCHNFNSNLKIGDTNQEVTALQAALQKEGLLTKVSGKFDEETASVITGFQEKYASEILTSWGLKNGTGFVGVSTRAKLNKLYGCIIQPPICIQVITPAQNPQTGECRNFSTPCDVPVGWVKVDKCPYETSTSTPVSYRNADFQCYDGKKFNEGGPTSCKSVDLWQKYAKEFCAGACNFWTEGFLGGKCGVNSFSVSNECQDVTSPVCIQVITYAQDLLTKECKTFSSPCDVPVGWVKVSKCPISPPATSTPSITVLLPNGGENWEAGKTYTISWKADDVEIGTPVGVYLSGFDEFGGTYISYTINSNLTVKTSPTYLSWQVPSTIKSDKYLIRVVAYPNDKEKTFEDSSDASFNIITASSTDAAAILSQLIVLNSRAKMLAEKGESWLWQYEPGKVSSVLIQMDLLLDQFSSLTGGDQIKNNLVLQAKVTLTQAKLVVSSSSQVTKKLQELELIFIQLKAIISPSIGLEEAQNKLANVSAAVAELAQKIKELFGR